MSGRKYSYDADKMDRRMELYSRWPNWGPEEHQEAAILTKWMSEETRRQQPKPPEPSWIAWKPGLKIQPVGGRRQYTCCYMPGEVCALLTPDYRTFAVDWGALEATRRRGDGAWEFNPKFWEAVE